MEEKERKLTPQERWQKKVKMVDFVLHFNPQTEGDLLAAIQSQGVGKQSAYIKRLIREDLEKSKK
jgi:hypothetical protein